MIKVSTVTHVTWLCNKWLPSDHNILNTGTVNVAYVHSPFWNSLLGKVWSSPEHAITHNCLGYRLLCSLSPKTRPKINVPLNCPMCVTVVTFLVPEKLKPPVATALALVVSVALVFKVRVTRKYYFRFVVVPGFAAPSSSIRSLV